MKIALAVLAGIAIGAVLVIGWFVWAWRWR